MKPLLPLTTMLVLGLLGSSHGAAQAEDPGAYGPGLDQVKVVRTLTIRISGGVNETISGKKEDRHTSLAGACKPDMFGNLSLDTGGTFDDHGGIGFATRADQDRPDRRDSPELGAR